MQNEEWGTVLACTLIRGHDGEDVVVREHILHSPLFTLHFPEFFDILTHKTVSEDLEVRN